MYDYDFLGKKNGFIDFLFLMSLDLGGYRLWDVLTGLKFYKVV